MGKARRKQETKLKYLKLSLAIIAAIISIGIIGRTIAKYKSEAQSQANVDLAYYLLKDQSISQELVLASILPQEQHYYYDIRVANYDGNDRTQTALDYVIKIKTTTNLPLNYEVYKQPNLNTSVISSTTTTQDSDGTYFRNITLSTGSFGFAQNEEATYRIDVEFPDDYNSADYEGRIEYIAVTVESSQKVASN